MRLITQVRQTPPTLTAGGYFEISRQLIPIVSHFQYSWFEFTQADLILLLLLWQLISTTITYVLILKGN